MGNNQAIPSQRCKRNKKLGTTTTYDEGSGTRFALKFRDRLRPCAGREGLPHRNQPCAQSIARGTHTHETTTKVVHDLDMACSGAGEDNLVSAANMGISCRQTGSPGRSHRQEQRGPWSKDDPATIHKQQHYQLTRSKT